MNGPLLLMFVLWIISTVGWLNNARRVRVLLRLGNQAVSYAQQQQRLIDALLQDIDAALQERKAHNDHH